MQSISVRDIIKATNGSLLHGSLDTVITSVSTDSRKINQGCLFVPLIGERFDGHDYIGTALDNGAIAALSQKNYTEANSKVIIKVEDTSTALRELAAYYRQSFSIPFVGITGSVGKTSTKDMIASAAGRNTEYLKQRATLIKK